MMAFISVDYIFSRNLEAHKKDMWLNLILVANIHENYKKWFC